MSKLPEDCPVCGERMDKGYLTSSGGSLNWSWKEREFTMLETEVLVRRKSLFSGLKSVNAIARRCRNCKIVLLSYGEEKGE